jgi:mannose-6-phosphate isomerase-like protein (cupin superfamily)
MAEHAGNEGTSVFLVDSYRQWAESQGVPLADDFCVDLRSAPVGAWDLYEVNGAIVNVKGRGDFLDMWLLEIPPEGATKPQRHLFEAVAYVISGRGSATVTTPDGSHSFEWGPKSMFALPLNAVYQMYNASGRKPVRLALTTSFPIMMNLFRSAQFIFGTDFEFERFSSPEYYRGSGRALSTVQAGLDRNFWETNFVPDLGTFAELKPLEHRGMASHSVMFLLADGILHAHMSEIPVGSYKKAHRHMGGTHIYPVTGRGYSLLWYEGETERRRVDWCHGVVYSPPDNMYHQHFNVSGEPARYFAVKMGNYRYPVTARMTGQFRASVKDMRETRNQIEYEDEDPAIRKLYLDELAKAGGTFMMR